MKRGRGRPRKGSIYSNFSNTQNSYLEEGKIFSVFFFSFNLKSSFYRNLHFVLKIKTKYMPKLITVFAPYLLLLLMPLLLFLCFLVVLKTLFNL